MNTHAIHAQVSAAFSSIGAYALPPEEARASLVEAAHDIGAQAAGILFLMLHDHEDPGQEAFDHIINATLEAVSTLLGVFFAELDQDEHPDLNMAMERAREGFLARLGTLGEINSMGGCA